MGAHIPPGTGKMIAEALAAHPVKIAVFRGGFAIVDAIDADLAEHRWCLSSSGYPKRIGPRPERKTVYLHHTVSDRIRPCPAGMERDHINGDKLDCRRANLRVVNHAENLRNLSGASKNSATGHLGVHYDRRARKWTATICFEGVRRFIGRFGTVQEAAAARVEEERRLWGIQPRRAEAHQCA